MKGNEVLGSAIGAMVAVVGDAHSKSQFLSVVEKELSHLLFEMVSLEDVELLTARQAKLTLPSSLLEAVAGISDVSPVAFGSFHSYES